MKVVILAGGLGTRISEESYLKPKPLIEIGEKPILWHIMKIYSHYGFSDFVICGGYKCNLIKDYFYKLPMYESDVTFDYVNEFKIDIHSGDNKSNPWNVTVVDTGLNTMTGGRIKRIENYIDDEDIFMFTYGDGVADIDINLHGDDDYFNEGIYKIIMAMIECNKDCNLMYLSMKGHPLNIKRGRGMSNKLKS